MKKLLYSVLVVIIVALIYIVIASSYTITQSIFKSDNATRIDTGKRIYSHNCASCHGINLQGQENWKSPLPSGRLPAPPHDNEGHTWHHSDQMLFTIIKYGPAEVIGDAYKNDMPSFAGILTDDEIN